MSRPSPLPAEPVGGRYPAVHEMEFAEAESVQAQRPAMHGQDQTRAIGFHEERRQPPGSVAGSGDDPVQVSDVRIADEDLLPIENVIAALTAGGHSHAKDMAAVARLGDRDRGQARAVSDPRQPLAFLLLVAPMDDLGGPELRRLGHGTHRGAYTGELLDDDRLGEMAGPEAAVRLVDGDADPSLLGDRDSKVRLDYPGTVHLRHPRSDLGLGEVTHCGTELPVLLSQIRVGHLWGSPPWLGGRW